MAKLLIFPNPKRQLGVEDAQRRWLEQNPEVQVMTAWSWPKCTWMKKRLEKVREGKRD